MKLIRSLLWIWCVMPASVLFAQPAPTIVSTLQTTNTGATSVSVGCAVGSSTCTGGISFGSAAGTTISLSGGYLELQSNVPGVTTYRLYNNSGNLYFNGVALATGGSLSGTTNKLAVFTGASSVGNSICSQGGTTLTCVDTISATTLTGTLSTASQPNVTGVGTLTTAVWNATKIGLLYGGTNADLSGTGGTSQFLRQNSVGAAVTVVRPAVSDLSDGANVALLNANNTFTGTNESQIPTTGTNAAYFLFRNTGGDTYVGGDNSTGASFGTGAYAGVLQTTSTGGLSLSTTGATAIRMYTNNLQRWGINSAGDWTFGASSHLADSIGTPTAAATSCSSGSTPTVTAGSTDYAMSISPGGGTNTFCQWNFGHTWSNAPVCVAMESNSTAVTPPIRVTTGATLLTVYWASGSGATSFNVLCRGY